MALPAALQALFDRLQTYNSDAYNASTNPGGFARGGNQKPVDNFIKSVRDFTAFGKGISDLTSQAGADAQATAADRVQTGQDRTAAAASAASVEGSAAAAKADADRAAGAAAGVNLPVLAAGDELKFLQVKQDRSGYQTASVQKATSAQVLAGTDDSSFLTPLTAQALWNRPRIPRTANTALTKANRQSLIDITSGTFTQTFAAAATLGDGWETMIRNSGTGDITLDPNGSETIDGLTSFIMYPGELRVIQCDGTALRSIVLSPFSKVFTASDNFIKPPGYTAFGGIIRSGGASGGKRTNTSSPMDGGGGGGAFPFEIQASAVSTSSPVIVGAGGTPQTVNDTAGNLGGDSSIFGITVGQRIGSPKDGGSINKAQAVTGQFNGTIYTSADFSACTGDSTVPSLSIYGGGCAAATTQRPGGRSVYGGGSGGSIPANSDPKEPGTSVFAGNGGAASLLSNGADGSIPSGGGGATRNGNSGAGARGQIDIWGIA